MAKSLRSKYKSKESFGVIKNHGSSKKANTSQPFQKEPLVRTRGNREKVKPYNNNTLQEEKQWARTNLLMTLSMSSPDLLSLSEFCKIYPLVV